MKLYKEDSVINAAKDQIDIMVAGGWSKTKPEPVAFEKEPVPEEVAPIEEEPIPEEEVAPIVTKDPAPIKKLKKLRKK